jgi:antitoxin Phd
VSSWQLQDAKAQCSEFLDAAALKKGPPVGTRRGVEAAVLVPIEEWRRMQRRCRPNIKEILLRPGSRFDNFILPKRRRWNGAVLAWIESLRPEQIFVSAVTVGEIQTGVELTCKQSPQGTRD